MFKRVLLLLFLAAVLVVPGTAENVIFDRTYTYSDTDVFETHSNSGGGRFYSQCAIYMTDLLIELEPIQLMSQAPVSHLKPGGAQSSGGWDVTFTSGGKVIGSGEFYYFQYYVGSNLYTQSVVDFIDVNWAGVVSGKISMSAPPTGYKYPLYDHAGTGGGGSPYGLTSVNAPGYEGCFWDDKAGGAWIQRDISFFTVVSYNWANRVRITVNDDSFNKITRLDLIRDAVPGYQNYSSLYITDAQNFNYTSVESTGNAVFTFLPDRYPLNLRLNTHLNHWFTTTIPYSPDDPGDPGDPGDQPVLRTGTVTMTDHNGTTITGFEVTAVNAYTNEAFTVVTQTDVAVMNLPMDRTIEIRNPQTGVYEEAPVGYYRFYGQKPGYKMLNEEGIKVSVMPQKYGSYKLCDILVTGESGPLTGKHQFQIRSRSDFSILQTGTISAKSRTTGDWYNTTVVNGLATLILPYDTSDALSEYAGHYYVYATSPGYEDSDYGTQIIVTPQTVSEVRTILLTPIGGVPTPGNVTLRIQAISETGQGVPNAEIFIAGVLGAGKDVWDTYTTSWTGFIEVSVPGNSTYDIVARGAGYYDSSRRIEVFTEDPPIIEMYLFLSGAPTIEPTTEPTGWVTGPPATQPTGGIPDEDDGSGGFLMEAVRGIGNAFGVGFATAKIILGMLLALSIGFATAKQLRGGAAEFGLGLLGGTMLGILVGLIPVWTIVVLLLVVGLYIGNRYVGGGSNNG